MSKYNCLYDISVENFLKSFYLSRTNISILMNSTYYINNQVSNSKTLKQGDIIEFDLSMLDKSHFEDYKLKIEIVYEDDYLLIVNKPIKILVHPDGSRKDTLANAVSFYYHINNLDLSVRAIHRLDYETSGLILFAKDALSHSYLNYQIENNLFKREYLAIVSGTLENQNGVLDYPIGKNRHDSKKYIVSKTGKAALTKYEVIKRAKDRTKVRINIETGRPHQIRVHFSYINHPIIGDELYGKKDDRMFLHASKLSFIHPNTRKQITVTSNPNGDKKWKI